jgi:oxaloacetate decarboxylase gamma subunit
MVVELLESGVALTAIGMTVVFVLLGLLVGIIQAMSALANALGGAPEPASSAAAPAVVDEELISVITAAINAYRHKHESRDG